MRAALAVPLVMGLAVPAGAQARPASARPPNVVLVVVEGLPAASVERSGLPALDRIAARGRRFDSAYATTSSRGGARYSLLAGLRPERTGVFADALGPTEGAVLVPQPWKAAGYETVRVGSLYGGPIESRVAWDHATDARGATAANEAVRALEQARSRPLFLAVGLQGSPADAPVARVPPALADSGEAPALPTIAVHSLDRFARPGGTTRPRSLGTEEKRQRLESLAAAASSIDAQLGLLVDAFDRSARWSDTVLLVTGACGADRGRRGVLPRPDLLFDDALRVPLVIAAPGVARPGTPSTGLVESIDVYPTLLALSGLSLPPALDGVSLVPLLENPQAPGRREAVSTVPRDAGEVGRTARSLRYRYTEWPDGSEELYDHDHDPRELRNLAADPALAAERERLRRLLGSRYAATPSAPAALPAPGTPRLNVLLIVLDDLGAQIGALGYPVQTPNIDRLAARGRLFSRAYAQVPSCSPSRSSLLSGWRPERTDVWNNLTPVRQHLEGAVPLQEHFHAHGYYTARVGKIYEPMFASEFPWDFDDQAVPGDEPPSRRDEDAPIGGFWQATDRADEDEPDGARALLVSRLLEANQDKPFFLAVGFAKPHLKWVAPKKYFDLYPPESIVLPAEPADDTADIPAIAVKNRPQERPGVMLRGREPVGFNPDPAFRRQATAAYYACVSFVDAQVGVLMQTLRRLRVKDRTIVVLLGDHGYHLGEHGGMYRKDTLFEEALRTALVVSAPQVREPGRPSGAPVEFLDVYPTLVDLAGLPPVAGLDGTSLRPLIEDPAAPFRPVAVSFRKAKAPLFGVSLRTDRYRYTQWPDGSEELYDHATDPDELKNLGRDPASAPVMASMQKLRAEGRAPSPD